MLARLKSNKVEQIYSDRIVVLHGFIFSENWFVRNAQLNISSVTALRYLSCFISRTCSPRWQSSRPVLSLYRNGWTAQRPEFRSAVLGYMTFLPRNRSSVNYRYFRAYKAMHTRQIYLNPLGFTNPQIPSYRLPSSLLLKLKFFYTHCGHLRGPSVSFIVLHCTFSSKTFWDVSRQLHHLVSSVF